MPIAVPTDGGAAPPGALALRRAGSGVGAVAVGGPVAVGRASRARQVVGGWPGRSRARAEPGRFGRRVREARAVGREARGGRRGSRARQGRLLRARTRVSRAGSTNGCVLPVGESSLIRSWPRRLSGPDVDELSGVGCLMPCMSLDHLSPREARGTGAASSGDASLTPYVLTHPVVVLQF